MTHGGQLSFSLQDVKIPFLIKVLLFLEITELPFNLGSLSGIPKESFLKLTLISFPRRIFSFIFKNPFLRKYVFF